MTLHSPIESVLRREEIVLFDTGLKPEDWYADTVRDSRRFEDLSCTRLHEVAAGVNFLHHLWTYDNVQTISDVTDEIQQFHNILSRKQAELLRKEARPKRHPSSRMDTDKLWAQRLFTTVVQLYHGIHRLAIEKVVPPHCWYGQGEIEKKVIEVSGQTRAKRDTGAFYGRPRRDSVSYTDELIVARAMYLAAYEKKSVGIVTGDADLVRITKNCMHRFRGLQTLFGEIYSDLKGTPVRVYRGKRDGTVECCFDTTKQE